MNFNFKIFFITQSFVFFLYLIQAKAERTFSIDYEKNTFLKDGKPFRYVSGSIHPYRVPRELWQNRLDKMWASGLNAIQIYIFWNEHEMKPGQYDFKGQNDVFEFIQKAHKTGFLVILRPGPYICAEHDFGGLPWWLLANGTDRILPRSSEANYMNAVRRWFKVLFPRIVPYLYKNGGPIITVQVENEYGSYYTCDKKYTGELKEMFLQLLGDDVILFTTDGNSESYLKCGSIPGVLATVDFGPAANVTDSYRVQRVYSKTGPLVNSEFYPGWLDIWGTSHQKISTEDILKSFKQQMDMNANVNFYMFFGGTNFGFSNGVLPPFLVEPTSYDYDAPLSEAGDITSKYLAIRQAISNYLPIPKVPIPSNSTKLSLGRVQMTYHIPLIEAIIELSHKCVSTKNPKSFEELGQGYGFILYQTKLDDPNVNGKTLSIKGIRDRAYVVIGSKSVGVLYRSGLTSLKINLRNNKNLTLSIIVENKGRLNFGNDLLDNKGIVSSVLLDNQELLNWKICLTDNFVPYFQQNLSIKDSKFIDLVAKYKNEKRLISKKAIKNIDFKEPAIYIGEFYAPNGNYDTFLKMTQFTKGVALIHSNDKLTNLGRYWPQIGPQITLYTPSVFLNKSTSNSVVFIEFEGSNCQISFNCYVEFIDYPLIDSIPNRVTEN